MSTPVNNTGAFRRANRKPAPKSSSSPPSESSTLENLARYFWCHVGCVHGCFRYSNYQLLARTNIWGNSATTEEGSWIPTAYLVAEIVVIPPSGWLSQVFSVRWYLVANSVLFLFFSLCCAWASSLGEMIVFRAAQGFTGGVLIPMSFTIVLTTLPAAKHSIGLALFTITATFAPSIGPTIGGWLTDNLGWEYNFYLNVIPGLILIGMVLYAIPRQPLHLEQLKGGDW